jgi:hypothetical protein
MTVTELHNLLTIAITRGYGQHRVTLTIDGFPDVGEFESTLHEGYGLAAFSNGMILNYTTLPIGAWPVIAVTVPRAG